MKDRENTFRAWAQGPGRTEEQKCENAIRAIRDAISTDEKFGNYIAKCRNLESRLHQVPEDGFALHSHNAISTRVKCCGTVQGSTHIEYGA